MAGISKRYRQQASDLTLVRFGPEVSALTALIRQAQQDRTDRIRSARSTAQLVQSSVDQARPNVRSVYDKALPAAQQAYSIAAPQIQAAGGPFAAAAALEQSGLQARLKESRSAALTDLDRRRVGAAEGAAYAVQAAGRDFQRTAQQVGQRGVDLRREMGAFDASTISDLIGADRAARQQARQQAASLQTQLSTALIGQGFDPTTGKPIRGGRLDPNTPLNQAKINAENRQGRGGAGGKQWATQVQQAKASDLLGTALTEANRLKPHATRAEAEQFILEGRKPIPDKTVPVYDTVTGKKKLNKDGTPVTRTVPGAQGVSQVNSKLLVNAALDLAYTGHLSRRTQNLLHARGIKIGPLGVTTFQQWLRQQQRRPRPGRNTQNLILGGAGGGSIP